MVLQSHWDCTAWCIASTCHKFLLVVEARDFQSELFGSITSVSPGTFCELARLHSHEPHPNLLNRNFGGQEPEILFSQGLTAYGRSLRSSVVSMAAGRCCDFAFCTWRNPTHMVLTPWVPTSNRPNRLHLKCQGGDPSVCRKLLLLFWGPKDVERGMQTFLG